MQRRATTKNIKLAYDMGRQRAYREFIKAAGAKDAIQAAEMLGSLIGKGGAAAKGMGNAAGDAAVNASLLGGLLRDSPRGGLLAGTGLAGLGFFGAPVLKKVMLAKGVDPGVTEMAARLMAASGMVGGTALAVGSNPGIVGGSALSRVSRELAAEAATPAGLVGVTAGLVGVPAALIGYGRRKERLENSFF